MRRSLFTHSGEIQTLLRSAVGDSLDSAQIHKRTELWCDLGLGNLPLGWRGGNAEDKANERKRRWMTLNTASNSCTKLSLQQKGDGQYM